MPSSSLELGASQVLPYFHPLPQASSKNEFELHQASLPQLAALAGVQLIASELIPPIPFSIALGIEAIKPL
jgi:hypothetical protein